MSDPRDPRRRTPDPRTPRASDRYTASQGQPPRAPAGTPSLGQDPLEAMLEQYARATDIAPRADLSRRVHAAISREPARTPPRRFLVALLGLKLVAARDAFGQMSAVALGRGRFSALVRAQALGLVVLTLGTLGIAGVAGALGITRAVEQWRGDLDDQPQLIASPSPSTVPSIVISPSPSASPSPSVSASPSAMPSPSPSAMPTPSEVATDDPTTEPDDGQGPGVRRTQDPDTAGKTAEPEGTPRVDRTPRPTRTPKATPRPTRTPRVTPRPTRTPKPTEKPEDTDKPGETDEPQESEGPDDDGGGGGGNSGPGSVVLGWSDAVVAVGPVLLVIRV